MHELRFCLLDLVRTSERAEGGLLDAALLVADDDLRTGFAKALSVLPARLREAELGRWGGLEDWFVCFREAGEAGACVSAYFGTQSAPEARLRVQDYQFAQKARGAALLGALALNGAEGEKTRPNPSLAALEYLALVACAEQGLELKLEQGQGLKRPAETERDALNLRETLISSLLGGAGEELP